MNDTYALIWSRVLLRCPAASSFLARDWVQNAFRQVGERRRWSWLFKRGQFLVPATYNIGTASVLRGSNVVGGTGTTWTPEMVGRQFRIAGSPIYTIASAPTATTLTLDAPYGGPTRPTAGYEIYQCYYTAPADFHAFAVVWDPASNWRLWTNIQQAELAHWDAGRTSRGQSFCVAGLDYLANLPRYELWPHPTSEYVYPFLYESRPVDLADPGAVLPPYIRGDVLVELALAEAARWPGPSVDKPNPYFSVRLSEMHQARAERMILDMERQDDETMMQNLTYDEALAYPYATPFGDSLWLQSHAI